MFVAKKCDVKQSSNNIEATLAWFNQFDEDILRIENGELFIEG